ncbi:unnamed protein product [Ectocarpus sp. CCAP 1310/34]|nr:unnamed protein product [Ectocarpus sp. CCAP 1310/34]
MIPHTNFKPFVADFTPIPRGCAQLTPLENTYTSTTGVGLWGCPDRDTEAADC